MPVPLGAHGGEEVRGLLNSAAALERIWQKQLGSDAERQAAKAEKALPSTKQS